MDIRRKIPGEIIKNNDLLLYFILKIKIISFFYFFISDI